jgi:hypothetical protein
MKSQDSSFLIEDVEELLEKIEEKDIKIDALLRDKADWESLKESLLAAQEKVVDNLEKRFSVCYSLLSFTNRALKRIARLAESERIKLEQQLGFLQHNPKNANFRDDIVGYRCEGAWFRNGRAYLRTQRRFTIHYCQRWQQE